MVGPPARAPARRVFRSADADEIQSMDAVGRDAVDEDLEEPDDMQGPSVSQRQKDIGNWLKRKCHMPSALLAVFYLVSLQTWGAFIVRPLCNPQCEPAMMHVLIMVQWCCVCEMPET